MEMIKVIIADDHQLLRAGLKKLLAEMPGMLVQAEVADGHAALLACDENQPDVVLMDVAMPVMGGLDALRELRVRYPDLRVLMLSMFDSAEHVLQALRLGAAGYLLKDAAPAELELAIKAVMRGEIWLSSAVSRVVIDGYMARQEAANPAHTILTPRQQEILRLIAEGQSTKAIAHTLALSVKTVETHRTQIMEKINVHDLAGLVRYAVRTGVILA